jgi:putative endonuclease
VEVKSRKSDRFGLPQEAVSRLKQRQIAKAALAYLKENSSLGKSARFDVVCVSYPQGQPKFDLIKNAFELAAEFTY